jgi:plastocyanin
MRDTLIPAMAGLAAGIVLIASFAILAPSLAASNSYALMNGNSCTHSQSDFESLLLPKNTSQLELKERTSISVAKLADPSKTAREKCYVVPNDTISKIPALSEGIKGADGCAAGTEVCEVSRGFSSVMHDQYLMVVIPARDRYNLSVSQDEALEIAKQFKIGETASHSTVLRYEDNFYALYLHSASANETFAQAEASFVEPVTYTPVTLEQGQKLTYAIAVRTWATYGGPAEVHLKALTMADSGLSIRIEPDHLIIPERSEAKAILIITADDAKQGIYNTRVSGTINNSGILFGPCGLGDHCPVIQVGDLDWEIRDYGLNQKMGMGGPKPPEGLRVEIITDKGEYLPGENVNLQAYLINDSQEETVIEPGARFFVNISSSGFVYTIDGSYRTDAEPIVVKPQSSLPLARPFSWNQKTFDSNLEPSAVQEGRYSIALAFSGVKNYVMHDRIEIGIGEAPAKRQDDFVGLTIVIPVGAYENESGVPFEPYTVTIPAGTSLRWENQDFVLHTATSGTPSSGPTDAFDTGFITQGEYSAAIRLEEPGEYPYYCVLHPWMVGTVYVVENYS